MQHDLIRVWDEKTERIIEGFAVFSSDDFTFTLQSALGEDLGVFDVSAIAAAKEKIENFVIKPPEGD